MVTCFKVTVTWSAVYGPKHNRIQHIIRIISQNNVFCTKCQPKVNITLRFFNDVREKQNKFETRLKLVEHKLEVVEENVEAKIDVNCCAL